MLNHTTPKQIGKETIPAIWFLMNALMLY